MKDGRARPGYIIFVIAFVIYVAAGIMLYSSWAFTGDGTTNTLGMALKAFRYVVYMLCIIKIIFFTDFREYHFIPIIIAFAIVMLALFRTRNSSYIFPALIIISFIDIPFEKILKVSFYTSILTLLITVLCSLFGIIKDYVRVEDGRTRHFLGFSWATYASIILFFIILEYITLRRGKINIAETAVIAALAFWLYKMTDARFAFALECAALMFFFVFGRLLSRERQYKRGSYYMLVAVPPLAAVASFFLHYMYNPDSSFWVSLNKLLSSRLKYGKAAIDSFGIHLLGQPVKWIGYSMSETVKGDYNYVDCSYLHELLENGALFLVLILIIMMIIIKCAIDKKDYHLAWIMVFISAFSVTEIWLCASLAVNPFLACISIWGTRYIWAGDRYTPYYSMARYANWQGSV